jgi:hypothetical protein
MREMELVGLALNLEDARKQVLKHTEISHDVQLQAMQVALTTRDEGLAEERERQVQQVVETLLVQLKDQAQSLVATREALSAQTSQVLINMRAEFAVAVQPLRRLLFAALALAATSAVGMAALAVRAFG